MKEEILQLLDEIEQIADEEVIEKVQRIRKLVSKAPKGKDKHKFNKNLVTMPFYIDYEGVKATVFWEKAKEFRILKGANLQKHHHLTAKGEKSFADKFGDTLRQEQSGKIKDFLLTEDVILKSPNEIGNFLYFAGVDTWKVLRNEEGESLGELTSY